ncbi:helix-turn-helix domain-containing protein [Aeromicrobium sp.]|uniref:helix-turn-helix domain-containing protein n=1 Tax=Aeromicrobium sp. TaxID=1871063 RepID=UPI0025BEBDB8|nr:helix-turn-helix domain-containing protein [Aeromicrobium sp.]
MTTPPPTPPRDRLRELLDAVLDEESSSLDAMAGAAYSSPFHFSRSVAAGAGEPPVSLRRRVLLERAAWRLGRGASVTEVAFEAGYDSIDGFARAYSRAFGHPPGATAAGAPHRLPAPNGVHFHPPMHLWISEGGSATAGHEVLELQVHHDVADTRALLERAALLPTEVVANHSHPGQVVLDWDGPEESVDAVLRAIVWAKEVWLAAIEGDDQPAQVRREVPELLDHHDEVAARWLAMVRSAESAGTWGDRVVDALCDPPESFVLGGIVTHVLTFSAHRRLLVRAMLRDAGVPADAGDPLEWIARRSTPSP